MNARTLRWVAAILVVGVAIAWFRFRSGDAPPSLASAPGPPAASAAATAAWVDGLCRLPVTVTGGSPAMVPAPALVPGTSPLAPKPEPVASAVVAGMPMKRTPKRPLPTEAAMAVRHAPPPAEPADSAPSVPGNAGVAALENVQSMLRDFRTRMGGNPVGSNAEIMRAVMGGNPVQAHLGPPPGQSLNAEGELLDPWGIPYFFHQLSAKVMEVRSAGPDRTLWTPDDIESR